MDFEITEPKSEQEFEEYYRLRYERLRKPAGLPPGSERNEAAEAASTHMIVKVDGRVIAAGCWAVGSRKDPDTGRRVMFVRYRQMAVDPEFEGRGLGSLLMEHVIESARKIGASEVVGNVRVDNVEWFKTFGYEVVGPGETLFGTIDNVSMSRPLP